MSLFSSGILDYILSNATDITNIGDMDLLGSRVTFRDNLAIRYSTEIATLANVDVAWTTEVLQVANLDVTFSIASPEVDSLGIEFAIHSIAGYTDLAVTWQHYGGGVNYGFKPTCTNTKTKAGCNPVNAYTINCFKC